MNESFEFDIFLSYSSKDKKWMRQLAQKLTADGLKVWFDEFQIKPGDEIFLKIQEGLDQSRTLILAMSPNTFNSDWVHLEKNTVLFRDPTNKKRRFIPILIQDCRIPDILLRYQYIDFRKEANIAYKKLKKACHSKKQKNKIDPFNHLPIVTKENGVPSARYSAKIIIVDDHRIVVAGLRNLLEKEFSFKVVGEAYDGISALKLVKALSPDIVVMDISMPNLNGIEATRQIITEFPNTKIIALSVHADKKNVTEMLEAGASGYLLKQCAPDELITATNLVLSGKIYLCPEIANLVIKGFIKQKSASKSPPPTLNAREKEVLQLIAEGKNIKEIANHICLSVKTTETHKLNIMNKLKTDNIAELIKYAIRKGLTSLD